eukprot:m.149083 g.149083  ORF g.149083 m.149083 type:complete len:690 (+) comp17338_c0_seq6:230-2299(+)
MPKRRRKVDEHEAIEALPARERAQKLVTLLTTAGNDDLDTAQLKALKLACRESPAALQAAFDQLMVQLEKPHAQIRFAVVQVTDELFTRSHAFRLLLVEQFQSFLKLAVGLDDVSDPLPPPPQYTGRLRQQSLECVHRWHEKFGARFKQISLGYAHLQTKHRVDFAAITRRSRAAVQLEQEREHRKKQALKKMYQTSKDELRGWKSEIDDAVSQLKAGFKLLVPDPQDLAPASPTRPITRQSSAASSLGSPPPTPTGQGEATDRQRLVRDLGLGSTHYQLTIAVPKSAAQAETEDNADLLAALRDAHLMCKNRFIPAVSRWISAFQKSSEADANDLIRRALAIKTTLNEVDEKYRNVVEDDDDEDMEDVPELVGGAQEWVDTGRQSPQAAASSAAASTSTSGAGKRQRRKGPAARPAAGGGGAAVAASAPKVPAMITASGARVPHPEERLSFAGARSSMSRKRSVADGAARQPAAAAAASRPGTDSPAANVKAAGREKLLEVAPVVPYGVDLAFWGKEDEVLPPDSSMTSLHRFWQPIEREDVGMKVGHVTEFNTRPAFVVNNTAPTTKVCSYPLAEADEHGDVKLCPRNGVTRCPFHGPIVPRNSKGQPTPEGQAMLASLQEAAEPQPEGQAPKPRRKKSNLIDVNKISNTARARLAKKTKNAVLNTIDPALDKLRADKHMDNWVVPQ